MAYKYLEYTNNTANTDNIKSKDTLTIKLFNTIEN